MSGYPIVFIQATAGSARQAAQAGQAARGADVAPTGEQLSNQIRQSIEEATRAAAQAAHAQAQAAQAQARAAQARARANEVRVIDGQAVIADEGDKTPTTIQIHRDGMQDIIPPQAVDISIAFFIMIAIIIIGWPLARAMGRRLERRADAPTLPDPAIINHLQRIEQAVEAMSIEIERISESQRFMAKLQNGAAADRGALGAGERR